MPAEDTSLTRQPSSISVRGIALTRTLYRCCALLLSVTCISQSSALQPSPTVDISIDRSITTPLNAGFSGYNTSLLRDAVEYDDPNFQQISALMSPGWLRFPAGTASGAYSWQSGQMVQEWVNQFAQPWHSLLQPLVPLVAGKGGMRFADFATMATKVGGAKIIVSVNAFTDTPESAASMAAYARDHNIPVVAWELANEAYFYTGFFKDAADYAAKMKPYRDAIKSVDPNAVVALFFSDAGSPNRIWDEALGAYPDHYWDAVTFHMYPNAGAPTDFSTLMTVANGALQNATSHVTSYLARLNRTGVSYMVTEFAACYTLHPRASLYEGIFATEYLLRMSSLSTVKFVGMHELLDDWGIQMVHNHLADVLGAYEAGRTIDTSTLAFGFYPSAQVLATAVANGVLKRADRLDKTVVQDKQQVQTASGEFISAIYAQAYEDTSGRLSLIITNKGGQEELANITVNGEVPSGAFPLTFVAGEDPSAVNTALAPNKIRARLLTTQIPIVIPGYSVVRLDL